MIQSFDSCDDFEIMSIDCDNASMAQIEKYIRNRIESKPNIPLKVTENRNVRKIDIRRNPRSQKIKFLKALIQIDNQIINMAIDTGISVFFLNWTKAKQILEVSKNTKLITMEILNLSTQFVNYIKKPIAIFGAITANVR